MIFHHRSKESHLHATSQIKKCTSIQRSGFGIPIRLSKECPLSRALQHHSTPTCSIKMYTKCCTILSVFRFSAILNLSIIFSVSLDKAEFWISCLCFSVDIWPWSVKTDAIFMSNSVKIEKNSKNWFSSAIFSWSPVPLLHPLKNEVLNFPRVCLFNEKWFSFA